MEKESESEGTPRSARKGKGKEKSSKIGEKGENEVRKKLTAGIKKKVSKKKKRYIDKENGFDLDLTYIMPNIMAMGFPSEGTESVYRNPMTEVQRLLELKHKDRYKIYNLCSERWYDHSKFHNRVVRYPFDDHNCPDFEDLYTFCVDVKQWVDEHEDNIAVIHCKAGKGRTGLTICCWLVYNGDYPTAAKSMEFYGKARTYNGKGVTIPSQRRYVKYFEDRVNHGRELPERMLVLSYVIIKGIPKKLFQDRSMEVKLNVYKGKKQVPLATNKYRLRDLQDELTIRLAELRMDDYELDWTEDEWFSKDMLIFKVGVPVADDTKIDIEKVLHLWFNTRFISGVVQKLTKPEVDGPHKDRKHKVYPKKFAVYLLFSEPEGIEELMKASEGSEMGKDTIDEEEDTILDRDAKQEVMSKYPSLMNL